MPSIGFIAPCQPSKAERPPSGPEWVHEIKHDGYRLMVHWDGDRVRCFTKNGHDWADRFPSIVEAARGFTNTTFLIDGLMPRGLFLRPCRWRDGGALDAGAADRSSSLRPRSRRLPADDGAMPRLSAPGRC